MLWDPRVSQSYINSDECMELTVATAEMLKHMGEWEGGGGGEEEE